MNDSEKFRLDEHLFEVNETIESAPEETREAYHKLVTNLQGVGINSASKRAIFLTFWLGVELQNLYTKVLSGNLREGKYFQIVCSLMENIVKSSFSDANARAWVLGSITKELAEESMRFDRQTQNSV